MWHDDDNLLSIINDVFSTKEIKFPCKCPICKNTSLHMFFFRFSTKTDFGGAWLWCSSCFSKIHTSFKVPCWWTNINGIKIDDLNAQVSYLERKKDIIDQSVNNQLSTYKSNQ